MRIDTQTERNAERPGKSGRHWSGLEERGVYLGLKIMMTTYRFLGRTGFTLLLYPVISYFFFVNATARRASFDYLSRIHSCGASGRVATRRPGWFESFRHFVSFGQAALDKLLAWTGKIRLEDVDFENYELFQAIRDSGRGGVLIASHLGNAEVCRALGMRMRGLKINVLVHTRHAENFNRLMRDENAQATVSLIQTTEVGPETAMLLRQRIDDGEFVIIVGDRTPVGGSPRVSWAPFLGRSAPFPQGPFILAALLKCPVLLIFCLKRESRFQVIFEPFSDMVDLPRGRRVEILDELVARYARRLEHHCLSHPYQWFNLFDFWNQASPPDTGNADVEPFAASAEVQRR